jgi:hypothetical protein
LSLVVPKGEAQEVELDGLSTAILDGDSLHHALLRDRHFAGIASFSVAGTSPYSRNAVDREAAIGELRAHKEPNSRFVVVHGGLSSVRRCDKAKLTGVSTPAGVNPKRPRCRRGGVYALVGARAGTRRDVVPEYVIQRIGSEVPGVKVPRWYGGFAMLTMPRWTGDRMEAMRFPTELAATDMLRHIAHPQDQYQILTDA